MSLSLVVLIVAAYLGGAIPFGLLVGRAKGIDVRTAGSKNIGATNVGRLLGKRYFWIVFALDAAKGLLPMLAGAHILHGNLEHADKPMPYVLWMLAGLAVMLGHMFPVYLGFKGGKGVATALGVMLGVYPYYTIAAAPALTLFLLTFAASQIISLSSILGASSFPFFLAAVGAWRDWHLFGYRCPLLVFATAMAGLIVFRHRSNIARLRAGTEPKFTKRKPLGTPPPPPPPPPPDPV